MGRVRRRVGDKRVLALIKAFCKAGILTQDGAMQDTITGTPQGGILSPLLANIALSILDEHFTAAWQGFGPPWTRKKRTRKGLGTWRLVRYADDLVVLVKGTRAHAQALCEQAAAVLAPIGLGLSAAKTRITHLDEGFDFLGFSHPAAAPARHEPAVRLHLPVQEGPCGHHRQGADPDPPNSEPITRGPAVPA